jgi:hypothetical protein
MQVGNISFCDQIGFNIKSDSAKEQILNSVQKKTDIKIIQKHFDNFQEYHVRKLNEIPHLISLKTNGNPYLLYLTRYQFMNLAIFIDKKIQPGYFLPRMIITRLQFDDELFDNTLFDGEMIKDRDGKWLYLINDVYCYNDEFLSDVNIMRRMDIIGKIITTQFYPSSHDICQFQVKKYFKYPELRYMVQEFKPKLNYTVRGIYFSPLYLKYHKILYNFDPSLISEVHRVKYQKKEEFLTRDNTNTNTPRILPTVNTKVNTTTNTKVNTTTNTNNTTTNTNNTTTNTNNTTTNTNNTTTNTKVNDVSNYTSLWVDKTDMPDVYNLYKTSYISYDGINNQTKYNHIDIAYVPNIQTSKFLKETFSNSGLNSKIEIMCKKIYKFGQDKWIPEFVPN